MRHISDSTAEIAMTIPYQRGLCSKITAKTLWSFYNIRDTVHHAEVREIRYGEIENAEGERVFSVLTNIEMYLARIIILAVGTGFKASIPQGLCLEYEGYEGALCHCLDMQSLTPILTNQLKHKIHSKQTTSTLIVGDGLSSAQEADMLLESGVDKAHLLCRGDYKGEQRALLNHRTY